MVTIDPLVEKIKKDEGIGLRHGPETPEEVKLEADIQFKLRTTAIEKILEAERDYNHLTKRVEYGLNGFRENASCLERIAFRVGLYVAIRAKMKGTYGIMITGGHRDVNINGIKIIEPDGSNLPTEQHEMCDLFVNTVDIAFSVKNLNELTMKHWPMGQNLFAANQVPQLDFNSFAENLDQIKEREAGLIPEP